MKVFSSFLCANTYFVIGIVVSCLDFSDPSEVFAVDKVDVYKTVINRPVSFCVNCSFVKFEVGELDCLFVNTENTV